MRNGLHILGQGPEGVELEEFITAIVRTPQGILHRVLENLSQKELKSWIGPVMESNIRGDVNDRVRE